MRLFLAQCFLLVCICGIHAQAQVPAAPAKLEIEILSFKIGSNYNPLLDRQPSVFSAESVELPQTEAEKVARRNANTNRNNGTYNQTYPRGVIAPEDKSTRGRLRSTIRVIDLAEWVNVEIKNTSDKTIKQIEWDFLFPRLEDNVLKLRYTVTSKVEVKTGNKKKLRVILPATAMKCKVINIKGEQAQESVCGKGFTDASKFEQENVVINRIEYTDGSVWKREP
jgi:hypothetical protein